TLHTVTSFPPRRSPDLQRERAAADRGHRGRAVRFGDVGNDADSVGKDLFFGHHRVERALRQSAMTDLAPARAAHSPRFADRKRRLEEHTSELQSLTNLV